MKQKRQKKNPTFSYRPKAVIEDVKSNLQREFKLRKTFVSNPGY